ncbi:hypothetical protein, partial [uncultured Methanobrevibacter sp.]|uniref:hypothetical protein n=1 Tax=uncultured Methanobrevibacter sp. TaxID=253161 RepID=UPI0025F715BB
MINSKLVTFNFKYIAILIIFSVLLVGVSGVCAQDINATDNMVDLNNNNDMVKNPIIGDENE